MGDRRNAVLVPDGPDAGLVWHYGDPFGEQRRMAQGFGGVVLGSPQPGQRLVWVGRRETLPADLAGDVTDSPVGDGMTLTLPAGRAERLVGSCEPVGVWAYEALRIAARLPRPGLDMDAPTSSQSTRLVHLDGSADDRPPAIGTAITLHGRAVGRLGTSAQHYELGPIALAVVPVGTPPGTVLRAGGTALSVDS